MLPYLCFEGKQCKLIDTLSQSRRRSEVEQALGQLLPFPNGSLPQHKLCVLSGREET